MALLLTHPRFESDDSRIGVGKRDKLVGDDLAPDLLRVTVKRAKLGTRWRIRRVALKSLERPKLRFRHSIPEAIPRRP